jgi:hypothetical protein
MLWLGKFEKRRKLAVCVHNILHRVQIYSLTLNSARALLKIQKFLRKTNIFRKTVFKLMIAFLYKLLFFKKFFDI